MMMFMIVLKLSAINAAVHAILYLIKLYEKLW